MRNKTQNEGKTEKFKRRRSKREIR